ncbi:DUF5659 domain-containing protein [Paenibacillus naphthalenovorans]|uniref:DUF5659 domain-containing protein n=1 Tax=Paenibacillus naphthalenovorans TaxID=162209 RepID=UPI003D26D999
MKPYVIKSQRLAGYLMMRGFVLKGMGENDRYPGRNVFFFKNSPELVQAIESYRQANETK